MIQISNLQLSLQRRLILDDISFTIHEHECLGLIGPNGAGKTTLLKCLSGMIPSRCLPAPSGNSSDRSAIYPNRPTLNLG